MKTKNSYDTRQVNKDFKKLKQKAKQVASQAVEQVIEQQADYKMSFDETETIPYVINERGNIVVSVPNADPIELEELISKMGFAASEELKVHVISGMREALNGKHS